MSRIYRIVYGGVCEIMVEAENNVITKILGASANELIGHDVSELPDPRYYESKLLWSDRDN